MSSTAVPKISFERWPGDQRFAGWRALAAAAVVGAGALVSSWPGFDFTRLHLQKRGFTLGEQDATKLHSILLQSQSMEIANEGHLPSSDAMPPLFIADGLPSISIATDPDGLTSRRDGIFSNTTERGRKWERAATVSYFQDGELRYETPVGIRLHGGKSRKGPYKSLQLVFRRSYAGFPRSTPGVFFEGTSEPYLRLVVSNTTKVQRFLNPLALEIAESAGCITSKSQPVRLVINGDAMRCGYFLIEHQSREFLRTRFGHDKFEWIRLKGAHRPSPQYDALYEWVKRNPGPITMANAQARFDLHDLCAWVMVIAWCGTTDNDQGGFFRDQRVENAPWRCVAWDLDGSFDHGDDESGGAVDFSRIKGLRAHLFNRLCAEDPQFPAYFREFARQYLEETFPLPEREKLFAKYRAIAQTATFSDESARTLRSLENTQQYLNRRAVRFVADFDKYASERVEKAHEYQRKPKSKAKAKAT